MTTTATTTSDLLQRLSAVNEAVIAHEEDEFHYNGDKMDIVTAVLDLVGREPVQRRSFGRLVANALERDDAVRLLKALIRASTTSQAYADALSSSGTTHVYLSTSVLRTATTAVNAVMDHIDTLMEV